MSNGWHYRLTLIARPNSQLPTPEGIQPPSEASRLRLRGPVPVLKAPPLGSDYVIVILVLMKHLPQREGDTSSLTPAAEGGIQTPRTAVFVDRQLFMETSILNTLHLMAVYKRLFISVWY